VPKKKQPSDINQLAHSIVGQATGQLSESDIRSQAAKLLGRLGGLKGGRARAASLSKKRRQEIARNAANARHHPS